jgi:bifunctional non-homologous end joining protein LigD
LSTLPRACRSNKVFVDWTQTSRHTSTVAVYSRRARPPPTVSTPVSWDEVEAAVDGEPLVFDAGDVLDRVAALGDLFADTLTIEQRLPVLDAS